MNWFIDSDAHRFIYRLFVRGDYKIIRMKSFWCATVQDRAFYGTWYGIPEKQLFETSRHYYKWPYFHGYFYESFLYIKRILKP